MTLNGDPHTVVAVLPPGIAYPEDAGLYVPSPYRVPLSPMDDTDRIFLVLLQAGRYLNHCP